MKKVLISVAACASSLCVGAAYGAQTQAYLGIFAETRSMKMIGMPDMSEMLKRIPASVLANNPALAGMAGGASRGLTVRLWSPGLAPQEATAALAIPAGLKLGDHLDLELYRPEPEKGAGGPGQSSENSGATPRDFIIKYYWGSSPTVKPGQPITVDLNQMMTPEMIANMHAAMKHGARPGGRSQWFYKPDWTTGHWPGSSSGPGVIDKEAALTGTYTLSSSYTGKVALDVPENVNFLAPLELTSPPLSAPPPLDQPIAFHWNAVPQVLGYNMMLTGFENENTLIIWQSSEVRADLGVDWNYMQMSQVRELVDKTVIMAGSRTDVTVPTGIFANADIVSMHMIGYGPGSARMDSQPLPRLQTKTTLTMMLGGKKMPKMNGRGRPGGSS